MTISLLLVIAFVYLFAGYGYLMGWRAAIPQPTIWLDREYLILIAWPLMVFALVGHTGFVVWLRRGR